MVTLKQAKVFAGTRGNAIKWFLISIYFNVKLIVLPKILPLMHLILKMDFTFIKYSSQGSLTVKERMADKLIFLQQIIGIFQQQVLMILSSKYIT